MNGANNILEIFYEYMGSRVWIVLLTISIVYIVIQKEKTTQKTILLVVGCSVLFLFNDVLRKMIGMFIDVASYYRFFWLIPVTMVCAYAMLLFWKKNYKLRYKLLLLILVFGVLFISEGTFWSISTNQFPENKYLMSDDIWQLSELINKDKNKEVPTVAMPQNIECVYRTYDANIITGIGRTQYLYFNNNGYDTENCSYKEEEVLAKLVDANQQQDWFAVKNAIIGQEVDYLVVSKQIDWESYMKNIDCKLVGESNNYELYRVDYNIYEKVTNKQEIENIKEVMGISLEEETIDLDDVEESYCFLVANDLHDFLLDDSVQEEKTETVNDRYNQLFLSPTGVHSVDLWNGMSAILDSYQTDGIVFIGDMIDYSSKVNAKLFKNGLENIETPYIYLRADHDLGAWYSTGENSNEEAMELSKSIAEYQEVFVEDYGEFYLVGWNNSTSQLTEGGLETMKKVFAGGKPIVLATHVPLDSIVDDSLYKAAKEADSQGRAKLWGERCLYKPDNTTQEFLDMVYAEDSPVEAVLAGHLHFKYTVKLTDNITEYVMPPAFSGKITMVTVE